MVYIKSAVLKQKVIILNTGFRSMKNKKNLLVLVSLLCVPFLASCKSSGGLKKVTYHGWENCYSLNNGNVEAIVSADTGGRILQYSINGKKVLWEDKKVYGMMGKEDKAIYPGGYQLDVLPFMRNTVKGYPQMWSGKNDVEIKGAWELEVTGKKENPLGFYLAKNISMDPKTGNLTIVQKVTNNTQKNMTLALWDRTWTIAPDYLIFPLREKSIYPRKWDFCDNSKKWRDTKKILASGQFVVKDGYMIIESKGLNCQIVTDCEEGLMHWIKGNVVFTKRFPFVSTAKYPWEGGGNFSVFVSSFKFGMMELEPASPFYDIAPGQTKTFTEVWSLKQNKNDSKSIVDKIIQNRKSE